MSIVNNKKLSIQITDTSINILIGNKNKIYETHTIELENGDCKDGNVRDKDSIVKLLNDYLDVICNLTQVMQVGNINANEKQVLNSTKSLVVEEISQSKDLSKEEASELLENAIKF